MDMWNAAIEDLNLDKTIARFEEENYQEMIFIGFKTKAWKFLSKAGLSDDSPHCCDNPSRCKNPCSVVMPQLAREFYTQILGTVNLLLK